MELDGGGPSIGIYRAGASTASVSASVYSIGPGGFGGAGGNPGAGGLTGTIVP